MITISTAAVAKLLGLARRTVQKWCLVLGFEKEGRDYRLTSRQVEQIRGVCHDKPGRPRKDG